LCEVHPCRLYAEVRWRDRGAWKQRQVNSRSVEKCVKARWVNTCTQTNQSIRRGGERKKKRGAAVAGLRWVNI
jgi:hypothetical protein